MIGPVDAVERVLIETYLMERYALTTVVPAAPVISISNINTVGTDASGDFGCKRRNHLFHYRWKHADYLVSDL